MTTSAHDLDEVRTTIRATRADLAGTTAALAAKSDVKARLKSSAATAAAHMKDSTSGVTRRLVHAVAPKESRQKAIGSRPARVESRPGRIESWRTRRAADRERRELVGDRPKPLDRVQAWWHERKERRNRRHGERPQLAGRVGDGW